MSSENQNLVPCLCSGSARRITDGNGIIVESLTNEDHRGAPLFQQPYTGRALVENNVSCDNDGRGINVFDGAHVDLVNNTLHRNAAHPAVTVDLAVTRAEDSRVINNIVVARSGSPAAVVSRSSEVSFDHNLLAGATTTPKEPALSTAAPRFHDAEAGDFRLAEGSPAVDSGTPDLAPEADADGRGAGRWNECAAQFTAPEEDELLQHVELHTKIAHQPMEWTPELAEVVKTHLQPA